VRSGGDTGRSTDISEGSREILERYGEIGSRDSKIWGNPCRLQRDLGKIWRNPGAIEGDSLKIFGDS
jgi:hypothetical protein